LVRTIKEATVKSFHYTSVNELRHHVRDWLIAYNFAKQLKALRFKTPYEAIEEISKSKPDVFIVQPHHHTMGLNTWSVGSCAVNVAMSSEFVRARWKPICRGSIISGRRDIGTGPNSGGA